MVGLERFTYRSPGVVSSPYSVFPKGLSPVDHDRASRARINGPVPERRWIVLRSLEEPASFEHAHLPCEVSAVVEQVARHVRKDDRATLADKLRPPKAISPSPAPTSRSVSLDARLVSRKTRSLRGARTSRTARRPLGLPSSRRLRRHPTHRSRPFTERRRERRCSPRSAAPHHA